MKTTIWHTTYELLTAQKIPLSKLSVRTICTACTIHHTTFYYHFEDKFALFSFGIEQLLSTYKALPMHAKLKQPFTLSNNFFNTSALQTLIMAQRHDPLAHTLITQQAKAQLVADTLLYLETIHTSLPHDLLAEQLIGTLFTLSAWAQTQTDTSDEELDRLYQSMTAVLFQ